MKKEQKSEIIIVNHLHTAIKAYVEFYHGDLFIIKDIESFWSDEEKFEFDLIIKCNGVRPKIIKKNE